ncbi:hypothetical protein BDW02DRAFT_497558 [Decorospora gaudefroyi]|uniref:Small secreted protein n=1 Tax=Decorospora gaudefroyi TaxID=184978 RepID=A0A6A5KGI2_9PLEO|nr:hypothetical protein BDW02DRAFT_497558 [Decorospora gaudefroyi]
MRSFLLSLLLPSLRTALAHAQNTTTYLTAPALITSPQNTTVIQCWRLAQPFTRSSLPGITGSQTVTISNTTRLDYTILPPRYDGGLHTAPVPQLVHFLSGLARITLPQDADTELWIVGGKGGLVFAADTVGLGHFTTYPSDQETVAIAAPLQHGLLPEHEVLNEGPCDGLQTFL